MVMRKITNHKCILADVRGTDCEVKGRARAEQVRDGKLGFHQGRLLCKY